MGQWGRRSGIELKRRLLTCPDVVFFRLAVRSGAKSIDAGEESALSIFRAVLELHRNSLVLRLGSTR